MKRFLKGLSKTAWWVLLVVVVLVSACIWVETFHIARAFLFGLAHGYSLLGGTLAFLITTVAGILSYFCYGLTQSIWEELAEGLS